MCIRDRYRFKGSRVCTECALPAKLDTYDLSEFIIKIIKDKYVMYTKDDKLISGMRAGSGSSNWSVLKNPIFIPKDKVNKTDYENAKFGLLGGMPFLHSFSNNGEIVPNKKYYSPNKSIMLFLYLTMDYILKMLNPINIKCVYVHQIPLLLNCILQQGCLVVIITIL